MPRSIVLLMALSLSVACGPTFAQSSMKPSAPQKMMPPDQAQKMRDCEKQAADQNIKLDERSKFVMDCMMAKAK
jgi:psiF repeat